MVAWPLRKNAVLPGGWAILGAAMSSEPPLPPRPPRRRIGRRGLLGGAAALAALSAFVEVESLRGQFDHRASAGKAGDDRYRASLAALDAAEKEERPRPSVVHVGHSTHLLAVGGLRFLTDPWFFDPAFGALAHERPPAVRPDELGRLDVLLVTHDHADHADLRAMDRMDKRALVLVSTAAHAARIKALGFAEVSVLAPWEERKIGATTVTAVPAQHDIYEIGFVVGAAGGSVYFAGDTRLHPDLPAIAERLTPDIAILPVDGTRRAGGALHVMTPDDAVTAARTLRSKLVIPSHAEAVFSDPLVEGFLASTIADAPTLFGDAMARALPGVRCVVPGAGQQIVLEPA